MDHESERATKQSASEAAGNDDGASGGSGGAGMDKGTASGPPGVDRGSGGNDTKYRARIVVDFKVELLSDGPRTMSVPREFLNYAGDHGRLFGIGDYVTVTLSADEMKVESIVHGEIGSK